MNYMQSVIRRGARLVSVVVFACLLAVPVLASSTTVYAAGGGNSAQSEVCSGIGAAGGSCSSGSGASSINTAIRAGLDILSIIAGVAAVIMIIIAGLKFITSQGDSSSVASARGTLIYALVGLAVVALSQFVVHFVLARV